MFWCKFLTILAKFCHILKTISPDLDTFLVLGAFCGHFLYYFDNFFSNLGASLRCYFFLAWLPLVLHDHDRNEKLNLKKKSLESGAVFFSSIFSCHTKGGDQPQDRESKPNSSKTLGNFITFFLKMWQLFGKFSKKFPWDFHFQQYGEFSPTKKITLTQGWAERVPYSLLISSPGTLVD